MSDQYTADLPALPSTIRAWKDLIAAIEVRPSKGKGQNFLFERGVVQRIVRASGVTAGDAVVEVGPGLGILTWELLATGAPVTSIELDWRLAEHLRSFFATVDRFRLVEGDALASREQVVASRERFIALRDEIVPRATQAIDPTLAGYSSGQLPLVSVIDAAQTLWAAQAELISAQFDLGLSWARLRRATADRGAAR